LQEYFQGVLSKKKNVIERVIKEFQRVYKAKDENVEYEKELTAELNRLRRSREKYMDMYTDDLISREELNEKIGGMRKEIDRLENELKMVSYNLTKGEQLEAILNSTFKEMEDITDVHEMTNTQLKRLINKIEVDKDGNAYPPFSTILAIEFGAGIHFNSTPNPNADKFGLGVGTFPGQIHAFEDMWFYWDETDQMWKPTHGVKATMPMYNAQMELINNAIKIAKTVF
jgi:hypothetical protein